MVLPPSAAVVHTAAPQQARHRHQRRQTVTQCRAGLPAAWTPAPPPHTPSPCRLPCSATDEDAAVAAAGIGASLQGAARPARNPRPAATRPTQGIHVSGSWRVGALGASRACRALQRCAHVTHGAGCWCARAPAAPPRGAAARSHLLLVVAPLLLDLGQRHHLVAARLGHRGGSSARDQGQAARRGRVCVLMSLRPGEWPGSRATCQACGIARLQMYPQNGQNNLPTHTRAAGSCHSLSVGAKKGWCGGGAAAFSTIQAVLRALGCIHDSFLATTMQNRYARRQRLDKSACPSGLRGQTQELVFFRVSQRLSFLIARAAWVRTPPLTLRSFFLHGAAAMGLNSGRNLAWRAKHRAETCFTLPGSGELYTKGTLSRLHAAPRCAAASRRSRKAAQYMRSCSRKSPLGGSSGCGTDGRSSARTSPM